MKTLLNCDGVFDVLTAGPFPSGDRADQSIQQHLAACSECRALAEALKPACDLLHEVMPAAEQASLPIYLAEENEPVQKIMQRVREQPVTRSGWGHHSSVKQILFWNSLAATMLLVLLFPWMSGGRDSTQAVAHSDAHQVLLGMALPADCLQVALAGNRKIFHPPTEATAVCQTCHESGSVVIAGHSVDNLHYFCCTECHSVSRTNRPQLRDVTRLVAACQTCHSAKGDRITADF